MNQVGGHPGGLRQLIRERLFVGLSGHRLYVCVSTFLPPNTAAIGKRRCLPVRFPSKLSTNSKLPSRSSSIATSADAPTLKVPRQLKISNVRDALRVAQAINLVERHAGHQELRYDIREVEYLSRPCCRSVQLQPFLPLRAAVSGANQQMARVYRRRTVER